jgi:hypothetical protein
VDQAFFKTIGIPDIVNEFELVDLVEAINAYSSYPPPWLTNPLPLQA